MLTRLMMTVVVVAALLAGPAARAQTGGSVPSTLPPIRIVGAERVSPIAVPDLKNIDGDDDHRVSNVFTATLVKELKLSGYFRVIDPHAYIEDSQDSGYELGRFNMADWTTLNADFLVKGAATVKSDQVIVEARLFDVPQQRQVMGKRYTGSGDDVAQMGRRFADAILKSVTGTQGPFDSKIAFVSTRGGRFKEVYTASPDGQDVFRVTNNPTINLFPNFDRGTRLLLYVSYKTGTPALYLADLVARREIRIRSVLGYPIGGAISPDGHSIVAAIEHGGVTDLHLMDSGGREMRALTGDGSINVSPAFSPDGKKIAFTSDRSGAPQIYVTDLDGGAPRRITYRGNYNSNPAFSPKGDRIAYQSRENGVFDIYVIGLDGGEPLRLTNGEGSNESASWSPDGRYLLFSSTRGGRARLYLMMVETGKIISALLEDRGDDTNPSWSWWLAD